jgi:hypothetical protein
VPGTRGLQDIAIIGDELRQLVLQANALTRGD